MNKKIVKSVLMIGAVLTMVGGATFAWFSDKEVSSGNILAAGTIDIAVDDENPWIKTYDDTLKDMKPSQVRWVEFDIKNVGGNPAVIWKHLKVTGTSTGKESEPECTDQGGIWDSTNEKCDWPSGKSDKNDIYNVITYDMEVDGDVLINGDWHVKMGEIESLWVPLGRLNAGDTMTVKQSYHIQDDAGNEYQGDDMTFDIELYAEQLLGGGPGPTDHGVVLENKTGDPDWTTIVDGMWGLLTYTYSSSTFDYTFEGYGLVPGTDYSLIYYADGWPGNNPGALINSGVADGSGNLNWSGSPDLGMDLPHPSDANYPGGAKIHLVPSACYNAGTNSVTCWPPTSDWLWESNLIEYDDTDIL